MAPSFDRASPLRREVELTQECFGKGGSRSSPPGTNVGDSATAQAGATTTKCAADHGMILVFSAYMPELVFYSGLNRYDAGSVTA